MAPDRERERADREGVRLGPLGRGEVGLGAEEGEVRRRVAPDEHGRDHVAGRQPDAEVLVALDGVVGGGDEPVGPPGDARGVPALAGLDAENGRGGGLDDGGEGVGDGGEGGVGGHGS